MKKILASFLLLIFTATAFAVPVVGLPKLNIPKDNPQTPSKIALGEKLFNDVRFSANNAISCASCHHADKAFSDGRPQAIGIDGLSGKRNSPSLVNVAYLTSLFHDGRRASLELQALDPLTNPVEHGLKDYTKVITVIKHDASYPQDFLTVFGISPEKINLGHVSKAIASYERTLVAGNSPFDQYFFKAERAVLSANQARGLRIFRRQGNCANCHEVSWNSALFTDNRFYNIGIGFDALREILPVFLERANEDTNKAISLLNASQQSAIGRFLVSRQTKDIGAYKTPTLRNIELTAPYMHDGSIKTLEEVVEYYDKGGKKNQFLNPAIFPLHLSAQEKADLVAFMHTLTSPEFKRP
jgi:cytochrome c peroxidase